MNKPPMRKLIYLLSVCIVLLFAQCASKEARIEKALTQYTQNENMRYPITMDKVTQLVKSEYDKSPFTLRYIYELSVPILAADTNVIKQEIEKNLLGLIKTTTTTKYFRESDVIFQYRYYRKIDGIATYQFQLNIGPDKYKK